jgi:hypothetical protein
MIFEAAAAAGLLILARSKARAPGGAVDPQTGFPLAETAGVAAAQGIKPGGYAQNQGVIAGGAAAGAAQGGTLGLGPIGIGVGAVAGAVLGYGLNDRARSAAASKGWAAVQAGMNDYRAGLVAAGVTDSDVIRYLTNDWGADFGIRGRNGYYPWPGKVPVQQSGIHAAESERDSARAALLARGAAVPDSMRIDGSILPGVPARTSGTMPGTTQVTGYKSAAPSPY